MIKKKQENWVQIEEEKDKKINKIR
uniref:Uncharacterized protein n=1 Tax=Anopheles quadriannulatus TaxID=34691 RepID=A0A182XRM5_ANOQN